VSSTKRGGQRSEADNYPTPEWVPHRLLEDEFAKPHLIGGRWLEPGAGDGAIIRSVNKVRSDIVWTALECREECRSDLEQAVGPNGVVLLEDYLLPSESKLGTDYDVAIGNPPFHLAGAFIQRSLQVAHVVTLLLRVNYLASRRRASFMREFAPDTYVLPNRPSFRGQGTDSPEYAWFMWTRERARSRGLLRVLAATPLEERNSTKRFLPIVGKRERERAEALEEST
jgi:hypothetical protein